MDGVVSAYSRLASASLECDAALPLSTFECRPPSDADRLLSLAYEVSMAEARERERLANGLHDTLGQTLAVAQFRLSELEVARDAAERQDRIDDLRALLAEASRETRRATFDLHSPVLEKLGLEAAVHGLAERMRSQCRLNVAVSGTLEGLSSATPEQAVVLRVVRELLHNVHKHAKAALVQVDLQYAHGVLRVTVNDNGVGCDLPQPLHFPGPEGGFGLASAEAQMRAIGGQLTLRSQRAQGTAATLKLPAASRTHRFGEG